MKFYLRKILFTLALFFSFAITYAQGVAGDIGSAIGSGNVNGVSKYFDNAVSMTISGSQSTFSKSQAEMVLKDFFNKNVPQSFAIEHSGGSNNAKYSIGTLTTSNGTFRTYFILKQKENTSVIQEIRFEK